jgi:hypothetical protein
MDIVSEIFQQFKNLLDLIEGSEQFSNFKELVVWGTSAIGAGLAYMGFALHETLLALTGALFGLAAGVPLAGLAMAVTEEGSMLVGGLVLAAMVGLGAGLAVVLERAIVFLGGFGAGSLLGSVILGVEVGNADSPLVLILGLFGLIAAWVFYKGIIIVMSACFGAALLGMVITGWVQEGYVLTHATQDTFMTAFWTIFLSGLVVQGGLLTISDQSWAGPSFATETAVSDSSSKTSHSLSGSKESDGSEDND